MIERELAEGRCVGVFIDNRYWYPASPGIHAWAVVEIVEARNVRQARLLTKLSEVGNGEGATTKEEFIPMTEIDTAPVTDAVTYQRTRV
ncbi:MAG TPA: hypothetical protein PKK58_08635 [Opitutaceae bacterium]|nr:hypothetical protein [Opitutaceae bacterium]